MTAVVGVTFPAHGFRPRRFPDTSRLRTTDPWDSNLTFVPVDFETDLLHEALHGAGFDSRTPAFFSWLGTTYYLTRPAIRGPLDAVATAAAPDSLLVLDFLLARHLIPPTGCRWPTSWRGW